MSKAPAFIHPTAEVARDAVVGPGTRVWHHSQIREGARVGAECVLGKGVYVDHHVLVGDRVKLQNGVSVFFRATLEDGVFVGPHACLTNDRLPRAITPDGELKAEADWDVGQTLVRYGASVGAGAVILTGITIGRWAMVGAGAVVTRDVPDHGLVIGVPALLVGYVCACGQRLDCCAGRAAGGDGVWRCAACGVSYELPHLPRVSG